MPIFAGITVAEVNNYVQLALQKHRDGLISIKEVNDWLAGVSLSDLTTAGFPSAQAQSILNAIADGMGEYNIHYSGSDPRNPGANYIYAATQESVIGPLLS